MKHSFLNKKNKNRGFGMMSFLVYIAVLSFIVLMLSGFVFWLTSSVYKAKAVRENLSNASRTIRFMNYEIRKADSVYTPTTTSNQLSLETTSHLPPGEKSTYIDFFVCGERVCFKKEGHSAIALTSNQLKVSKLEFDYIVTGSDFSSVEISLSLEHKNPHNLTRKRSSVSFTSTASLRSY